MSAQLSAKEWQKISEYLDGQLAQREREHLEQQLKVRPELRAGLDDLRQTRALLRRAPRRRLPHNFTLSPQMLPKRRPLPFLVPLFSASSALATILAVVLVVMHLLPGTASQSTAAKPETMTLAQAPQTERAAEAGSTVTPTPMIILWNYVPAPEGQGGYGGGDAAKGNFPSGVAPEAPLSDHQLGVGGQPSPTEEMKALAEPQAATPQAKIASQPTQPAESEKPGLEAGQPPAAEKETAALNANGPILGLPSVSEEGKMTVPTEAVNQQSAIRKTTFPSFTWLVWPMRLVVFALLMGLAAILLWRRNR